MIDDGPVAESSSNSAIPLRLLKQGVTWMIPKGGKGVLCLSVIAHFGYGKAHDLA